MSNRMRSFINAATLTEGFKPIVKVRSAKDSIDWINLFLEFLQSDRSRSKESLPKIVAANESLTQKLQAFPTYKRWSTDPFSYTGGSGEPSMRGNRFTKDDERSLFGIANSENRSKELISNFRFNLRKTSRENEPALWNEFKGDMIENLELMKEHLSKISEGDRDSFEKSLGKIFDR